MFKWQYYWQYSLAQKRLNSHGIPSKCGSWHALKAHVSDNYCESSSPKQPEGSEERLPTSLSRLPDSGLQNQGLHGDLNCAFG